MKSPQEISDYRMQWYPGVSVSVNSGRESSCVEWCRSHLNQYEWFLSKNTDVIEHTFRFEHAAHARAFNEVFNGE